MREKELKNIGVWFPAVRSGTGADVFTERLAAALSRLGVRTEITWLPHRAEYIPWAVPVPKPPEWATVVHVNSWLHSRFIPKDLPVIATFHSCVHDEAFAPYKTFLQSIYHKFWIKKCERFIFRTADQLTAVSEYTAKVVVDIFGYRNISAIHNWVDHRVFTPPISNPKGDKFSLLFVGTTSIRKGADLLRQIMHSLGDRYELRFTADSSKMSSLIAAPNITPIGRVHSDEELARLYKSADVLLFPTRLEGFGLVALEAQACGLPVIASDTSSLPEVVIDGISGILCPRDDISAFVSAIKKIAQDDILRLKMGRAASDFAQTFSENKSVSSYLEIYQAIGKKAHEDRL